MTMSLYLFLDMYLHSGEYHVGRSKTFNMIIQNIHSSRGTVVCNLHFILKPTVIGHLAAVVLEFITFIGFIVGYLV